MGKGIDRPQSPSPPESHDHSKVVGSRRWWLELHSALRQRFSPRTLAGRAARHWQGQACDLLVIGKAAAPLSQGLREGCPTIGRSLIILPTGCRLPDDSRAELLSAEHPIPGRGSFAAGERVRAWLERVRDASRSRMATRTD